MCITITITIISSTINITIIPVYYHLYANYYHYELTAEVRIYFAVIIDNLFRSNNLSRSNNCINIFRSNNLLLRSNISL